MIDANIITPKCPVLNETLDLIISTLENYVRRKFPIGLLDEFVIIVNTPKSVLNNKIITINEF